MHRDIVYYRTRTPALYHLFSCYHRRYPGFLSRVRRRDLFFSEFSNRFVYATASWLVG